ncbi:hypothetical protein C8R45DRAFT_1057216 [Mycena sanguinolenta]|nr:hypothetical protein C8R45DRAFT_1057216 [Mycena sanguinolenta]
MPEEHLENFRALGDFAASRAVDVTDADDDDTDGAGFLNIHDVLDGTTRMDVSHAGGEFIATLQDGIEAEVSGSRYDVILKSYFHILILILGLQKEENLKARLSCPNRWNTKPIERMGDSNGAASGGIHDMVRRGRSGCLAGENTFNSGGDEAYRLVPCSPWTPSVAIATRVLELYRTTHIRCPQLAIQAFVKSLCDLHGVGLADLLCLKQFSIAYDIYLDLRRRTDGLLIFSMLTTMGGNDSLKRVLRRSKTDGSEDEPTVGPSIEREDSRDCGEDYFLTREQVDRWAKERVAEILLTDAQNPCSDRWKNMVNDVTSRMWGIFDETEIFLALCRHGFALVVADMVRSGELAKYPLAIVNKLLDAFGLKIGRGYDIGCHFETTVNNSDLGDKARNNQFRSLVGSFHGHAHNRLSQLSFLATYVQGMGLEDLEGCERYFSRSNGLARSIRYDSKFHRKQEITTFMRQMDDLETYANLSKFLCDNYRQALKILKTEPELKRWMSVEKIDDYDTFHVWLEEERDYLMGMDDGLPKKREETVEMEERLSSILRAERAALSDGADFNPAPTSQVARRHAVERRNRDIELVEDLESKLGVTQRWTSAKKSIKDHRYLDALDEIERIIVERLFEMTKIHQSGTGYKMRRHIAKALQARSKAIRNAIDRYNAVAEDMTPPKPTLSWEEVVNYGFLAEFDILRDTADSIHSRPWTRRSYRVAMDRYFKILWAKEEIQRLNVEIKHVVTWIEDEDRFLRKKEAEYKDSNSALAFQISQYRQRRARSDHNHMQRFWALAKTPGFTGSVVPGEGDWEDDDDEGEGAEQEAVSTLMYQIQLELAVYILSIQDAQLL